MKSWGKGTVINGHQHHSKRKYQVKHKRLNFPSENADSVKNKKLKHFDENKKVCVFWKMMIFEKNMSYV